MFSVDLSLAVRCRDCRAVYELQGLREVTEADAVHRQVVDVPGPCLRCGTDDDPGETVAAE